MRIIQIVNRFPPSIGGAENYVFNLSKNLQQLGHQVLVLTSDLLRDDIWARLPRRYEHASIENVTVRRFKAQRFIPGHGSGVVIPGIFQALLREHEADVLHANSYGFYSSYAPILAGRIRRIPVVFTTLLSTTGVMPSAVRLLYNGTIGRFTLRSSAHLITLTDREREELRRLEVPDWKISVIPPGIDIGCFLEVSGSEVQEFRERINPEGKIALFVGRLGRNKGVEELVAASPFVVTCVPKTKFLIVGDDWGMRHHLEMLAHKLQVTDSVIFAGRLSKRDLIKAYLASDLFVFPSLSAEAYGLVLLEAMVAGKPIVAFRGMTPEILREGRNCVLARYGDHVSLADSMVSLLLDTRLSNAMGKNNRQSAAKYSWESVAQRLVSIYRRVAENYA